MQDTSLPNMYKYNYACLSTEFDFEKITQYVFSLPLKSKFYMQFAG